MCMYIIHSVFCLTTGSEPPQKRFLHVVRSRASSFKREYPFLSLRLSSSLRLLPRLFVTSISPFIFPSITCFRKQIYIYCVCVCVCVCVCNSVIILHVSSVIKCLLKVSLRAYRWHCQAITRNNALSKEFWKEFHSYELCRRVIGLSVPVVSRRCSLFIFKGSNVQKEVPGHFDASEMCERPTAGIYN